MKKRPGAGGLAGSGSFLLQNAAGRMPAAAAPIYSAWHAARQSLTTLAALSCAA